MNFREQYTLMYHSNIFMIIHGHIISYTFVNSFFPPRYMKIYFTANIVFSAVVPQTLRIMQAAYGLYITLNSILHYAYWVEVHRAVHHKHSFPWMNRHIIYMKIYFTGNIIFSAIVPQTLRIMQAAYGLYITLNSILHYAYWVEVHRAVHHKHSFPWMNRHII